jgi:hypothetical protein
MRLPTGNRSEPAETSRKLKGFVMVKVFAIMLAVDLLLTIATGLIPFLKRHLPLGGSDLAQLGVCLGLAAAYVELAAPMVGMG